MRIQDYLTCDCQNMKVLIAYASKPKKAAAVDCALFKEQCKVFRVSQFAYSPEDWGFSGWSILVLSNLPYDWTAFDRYGFILTLHHDL